MLRSLSDTLQSSARAESEDGEETLFPIHELFLDPRTHEIRYVALDAGNWFETTDVLVSSRLLLLDEERETWTLELTPEAVEDAPVWEHGGEDGGLLSVEHWPPVVVGPFGHTTAPLMIWAEMAAAAQEAQPPHPPVEEMIEDEGEDDTGPDVDTLDRATSWLGKPVFGADGEMGIVADIGFDADSMNVTHIVVDNDKLLTSRQAVFPISALRHRAGTEGHFVLNAHVADMESAPTPEEVGLGGPGHAGFFAPV